MTQSAVQTLEEKITEYQATLKPGQWRNAEFLITEVNKYEANDLALAHRLLQRIRILRPEDAVIIKRENVIANKLALDKPDMMMSSSKEQQETNPKADDMESGLNILKNKVLAKFNRQFFLSPFFLLVILPVLCFAFYQVVWASPRFVSQTQLIIKQPDSAATLDPKLALLSGFGGGGGGGSDTELVKAYIYSNDMYRYLNDKIKIVEHFSHSDFDVFSRLSSTASIEDKIEYYKQHLTVEINDKSSIVSIYVQGFEPVFALAMTQAIVERAEWYINEIGHRLAKEQLSFVQNEHKLVEKNLQEKKSSLLAFQRRYNLLNPEAEGLALQQITYELEGQIAAKKAELRTLMNSMSDNAPLVLQAKEQLDSLNAQLRDERSRLTKALPDNNQSGRESYIEPSNQDSGLGVNEVMSRFTGYKMDMEFALQAYGSSQVSLEKSRIEAYRQLKFLMVVETPTLAQEAKYPRAFYNIALLSVILLLVYGIGKIVLATIKELQ
jgi:capsular polysaccharide transport system permease protein